MTWMRKARDYVFRLIGLTRGPKVDRIPEPEPAWPHDYRSLYELGACKRCGYRNTQNWRPCVAPRETL